MINNDIEVTIVEIKGGTVKIGITAPRSVLVYRKEIYEEILRRTFRPPSARGGRAQDQQSAQLKASRSKDANRGRLGKEGSGITGNSGGEGSAGRREKMRTEGFGAEFPGKTPPKSTEAF
jgi:carbon storage regulator CsrA